MVARPLNQTAPITALPGSTVIANPPPQTVPQRIISTLPPSFASEPALIQLSPEVTKQLFNQRDQLLDSIVKQIKEGKGAFITSKRDGRQLPMLAALDMDLFKRAFDMMVDYRDRVTALLEQGS